MRPRVLTTAMLGDRTTCQIHVRFIRLTNGGWASANWRLLITDIGLGSTSFAGTQRAGRLGITSICIYTRVVDRNRYHGRLSMVISAILTTTDLERVSPHNTV